MTLVSNSAEAGVAAGTAVDTTNSATGGTAFTTVVGAGITYTATSMHGSLGIQFAANASTSTYVDWVAVAGATNATAARVYFFFAAIPSPSTQPLMYFRSSGGGTGLFILQLNTTGRLIVTSDAAAGATQGTATNALSINTWYRIEIQATNGVSTTGTFDCQVYLGDTTTPVTGAGLSLTALNLGTSTIGTIRIGRPAAIGAAYTSIYDDLAFQTGSAAAIGPVAALQDGAGTPSATGTATGDGTVIMVNSGTASATGTATGAGTIVTTGLGAGTATAVSSATATSTVIVMSPGGSGSAAASVAPAEGSSYDPTKIAVFVTLVGTFLDDSGDPLAGTIVLTPDISYLVDTVLDRIITVRPRTVRLSAGTFSTRILANGFTWRWRCDLFPDDSPVTQSFYIRVLPTTGTIIDIADAATDPYGDRLIETGVFPTFQLSPSTSLFPSDV
jgi:hypothetical protein